MFDDFDELMAFVCVAEAGSFIGASLRLERDASVISRRVSHLEKKLGVRLLVRTTRSVTLTEAGTWFLQRARTALDELSAASREVGDFAATPQGTLRVSLPVTFGRELIAPMFPDFLQAYPDIRLDAHFLDRRVDIVAEGFDAVIRLGNVRDSTLTGRELGAFRSQLIASPAYLQRYGEPTHPEQLAAHRCLGFTSHPDWPYWILENGREHIQVTPAGPLTTNISEALLTAVIRATGIALLPGWMVNQALQRGELVRVLPDWRSAARVSVYALMPPGTLVPAKTRVFIDAVCQQLASSPLWQDELKR
ncbi:LysR family transcriptional regulator [Klebsiella sp. G-Nf4]|uniref:LysR family transcriptional regulator n=1 Tax=Klebsiella TaxID=570 RepID=UPI0007D0C8B9|nr:MULTISPECIES: LysR family transcriptional regulator [Klebsiella]PJR57318.1 LysR family transcriptional regulator [Klebsiella sp. I-Nf8]PJR66765.1 LysR family transcriptional regulator [Klebsiella sp. K-Nf6]PJX71791.1 LysR family transcriptional regulator [Klebsiella sp. G-Nf4]PJX74655.1 LysR family transcriptional regulator [Klebsiella sp. G2-16S-Nf13]PKJ76949.1 LysR family transcriptional regulator [Klebsiella sp. J-Nf11]